MRIFRCFVAVVGLVSAVGCASRLHVQGSSKVLKPVAKLSAGPLILPASLTNPPTLFLRVSVRNVNEEFWCPGIRWIWPDGTVSEDEGDCEPFNPSDSYQRKWTVSKEVRIPAFRGGPRTVGVQLVKAGRVIWFDKVTVIIASASE